MLYTFASSYPDTAAVLARLATLGCFNCHFDFHTFSNLVNQKSGCVMSVYMHLFKTAFKNLLIKQLIKCVQIV